MSATQDTDETVTGEIDRVLRMLEVARDQVSRGMRDAIVDEVPLYRQLTDRRLADVEAQCSRQVTMFLTRGRVGSKLAEADLAEERTATARRAKELMPLDSLLHATRVAHRVARQWLITRVEDGPTGKAAALRLSDLGFEHADAISTVIATEYVRCEGRRVVDEDRERRDLLERLLSGASALDDEAEVVLASGLRQGPYVTLVMTTRPLSASVTAEARECAALAVRALARGGIPAFGAARHGETVVVAGVGPGRVQRARRVVHEICAAMALTHRLDARAGISRPHATLGEVRLAYAEASRALRHAGAGSAAALSDILLMDYLVAEADALAPQLVPAAVRRLLIEDRHRGGALAKTLSTFASCDLNAARAAAALYVHVNTVHYRLRRIAELTGLEPRRFQDLIELTLAIRLAGPPDATL